MTAYATTTDFTALGLPAAALGSIDPTAAIAAASARADGYLASRYTLPLVTWGEDLRDAVCAIAAYTLLSQRGFNPDAAADANVRDRYLDAIRWLEGISASRVTPVLTDSSGAPGALGGPFVLQGQVDPTTFDTSVRPVLVAGRPSARGW